MVCALGLVLLVRANAMTSDAAQGRHYAQQLLSLRREQRQEREKEHPQQQERGLDEGAAADQERKGSRNGEKEDEEDRVLVLARALEDDTPRQPSARPVEQPSASVSPPSPSPSSSSSLSSPPTRVSTSSPPVIQPQSQQQYQLPPANDWRVRRIDFDASVSRERGVIVALHNGIVALGASLLSELRCLGNNELIQVYHCLPNELSPESRALLLRSDRRIELVDVCTAMVQRRQLTMALALKFRNWWVKPLALYHTDLQHVLLLDADAILLRDPAVLRSLPGYQRTGTTFFHDRVVNARIYLNARIPRGGGVNGGAQYLRRWVQTFDYARFGLSGPAPSRQLQQSLVYNQQTCHEMDSSLLAVDKARAGKTTMDVLWYLITQKRFEFTFSWGDKEAFWLAFEFAHRPYFFSPWGVSVVESSPNRDMERHADTLCGNMAHFLPVDNGSAPELLYVNGEALVEPFPLGVEQLKTARDNQQFNLNPRHVTPRHARSAVAAAAAKRPASATTTSFRGPRRFPSECLVGLGATPLPPQFHRLLLRRRMYYLGVTTGVTTALDSCALL
ncbi:hypothetical protein PINS_up002634 [Pythium insidiosum]|nr:hypothetical protein PINS_up002634 [Pythium insidiosum]